MCINVNLLTPIEQSSSFYSGVAVTITFLCLLFWCWRQNIPALGVNNMPVDALAPKVASASAGMVLSV